MVSARGARRLETGDRVEFIATERGDGVRVARRVRIYRRPR
jgi:hypothetical protein